jgi:membrane-associated phospholipid phosphatase
MSLVTRRKGRGPTPGLEIQALAAIQATIGAAPGATSIARGMSHFGEHALGWMAISAAGAALDAPRRREWAAVGVGAVGAHAASIVVKRISRRRRPSDPSVKVGVSTPSQFSFPSSHATSTTAAAVLIAHVTGKPVTVAIAAPMMLSRLVLGVHYPSDVLVGAALGAASAAAVVKLEHRYGAS